MTGWTAIVPVKAWHLGKRRLHLPSREALAEAFALDTLEVVAASACVERVLVVSSEPGLEAHVRAAGATMVDDRRTDGGSDLLTALRCGVDWSSSHPTEAVVVVPADLACLTPTVLDQVLRRAAGRGAAFVPDVRSDGTTLLMADRPDLLPIAYGPDSAARHEARGAQRLSRVDLRARQDVDTIADLDAATTLGLGARSAAVARRGTARRETLARY